MKCIDKMMNISFLVLTKNKFSFFSNNSFNMPNLMKLEMAQNNLINFDLSTFKSLTSLSWLSLDEIDNYKTLHEILPQLSFLDILATAKNCSISKVTEKVLHIKIKFSMYPLRGKIQDGRCRVILQLTKETWANN